MLDRLSSDRHFGWLKDEPQKIDAGIAAGGRGFSIARVAALSDQASARMVAGDEFQAYSASKPEPLVSLRNSATAQTAIGGFSI